jgi:hypothetical protein
VPPKIGLDQKPDKVGMIDVGKKVFAWGQLLGWALGVLVFWFGLHEGGFLSRCGTREMVYGVWRSGLEWIS